ncbi:zeta toxin family protein [Glutamicibacter arilaitensis]|uniref:zeta toxin family protein n=1 Tax=Glutamicibacter arilaitensis TaxID=256701 RepID=UPI00385166A9
MTQTEGFTLADSAKIEQHRQTVSDLSKPGEALAKDSANVTVRNPSWFTEVEPGSWVATAERQRLHDRLKSEFLTAVPLVRADRRALILAGPPGAGKSTLLGQVLEGKLEHYVVIDADEFKESLLREAQDDGSYEAWIKPRTVKDLEARGEEFFPMDLATLVHEESSILAAQLRSDCIALGYNLVVDKVLSSVKPAQQLMRELDAARFSVQIIEAHVPYEVSKQRITERWEQSHEASLDGEDDLGARWVPYEFAREVFQGPEGKSKPEAVAEQLANECPAVRRYRVYRTTDEQMDGSQGYGQLRSDFRRAERGAPLVESEVAGQAERR